MLLLILYNHLYHLFFQCPAAVSRSNLRGRRSAAAIYAGEQAKITHFVFREGGVTACNIRGRTSKKDIFYLSRNLARLCGINSTAQTQRKKENKVILSGGEAPQQFARASRHKRQIVFFAKPCPFVRHKRNRTN